MQEVEMKLKPIEETKETLIGWVKEEVGKGKECVDCHELGEAIDMIKDLAEAEEKCWKAHYYKAVIKAMNDEDTREDRRGYDHYRYADGRFAPTGHGSFRGYTPEEVMWMRDPEMMRNQRLGFSGGTGSSGQGGSSGSGSSGGMSPGGSSGYGSNNTYGRAYEDFKMARRNYTASHSESDRKDMTESANRHVHETIATMKELWSEADPELKKRMKSDLTGLMAEMN